MMEDKKLKLKLFTGNSNIPLAKAIANHLKISLGKIEVGRFPDGEISVKIKENIRGQDVFIIQSLSAPVNENLMELLVMIDAFKRASAKRITSVISYYGYARQDRKDEPRVPITAKLVADLLTAAGTSRVLTIDLHTDQIQGFFNIPVDHLYAARVFIEHLTRQPDLGDYVVISPDTGSVRRVRALAQRLGKSLAIIDKRRDEKGKTAALNIIGEIKNQNVFIFDDQISTGSTIKEAVQTLLTHGAGEIYVGATHGVFSRGALEELLALPIKKLMITDTINLETQVKNPALKSHPKLEIISVAWLLGEAIKSIHYEESVSRLFI
jgi:ribose-phosphate pyrophosphokinase